MLIIYKDHASKERLKGPKAISAEADKKWAESPVRHAYSSVRDSYTLLAAASRINGILETTLERGGKIW